MQNDEHNRSGIVGLLGYVWTEWISTLVVLILLLLYIDYWYWGDDSWSAFTYW